MENSLKSLLQLKPGSADSQALFLIHPVGGSIFCYLPLLQALDPKQTCYGFQIAGVYEDEPIPNDIEVMAKNYLKELKQVQAHGPYLLGGWSMGGTIAREMACQLREQGEKTQLLILIDSWSPQKLGNLPIVDDAYLLITMALNLGFQRHELNLEKIHAPKPQALKYLLSEGKARKLIPPAISAELFEQRLEIMYSNFKSVANYKFKHKPWTDAYLSIVAEDAFRTLKNFTWKPMISKTKSHILPGDHYSLLRPPTVTEVARLIQEALTATL